MPECQQTGLCPCCAVPRQDRSHGLALAKTNDTLQCAGSWAHDGEVHAVDSAVMAFHIGLGASHAL